MSARLRFEFSSSPIDAARLVLMHADTGFLHAASPAQEAFIAKACEAAEFIGKTGSFMALYTDEGPVLVGSVWCPWPWNGRPLRHGRFAPNPEYGAFGWGRPHASHWPGLRVIPGWA